MTKYPPPHHQEANFDNCIRLTTLAPLATIITSHNNTIHSTHTPLVHHRDAALGYFIGHIDAFNPQLEHFKAESKVSLIFHGPETYISPSVYQSTQLPTWNYFKAHFEGTITTYTDPKRLRESLITMTSMLEKPNGTYELKGDNPRMEALMGYIVGFKITVTSWEGKFKISQDKHPRDQQLAKKALENKFPGQEAFIEQLYVNHQTKR
jgi:transcriptional regulator